MSLFFAGLAIGLAVSAIVTGLIALLSWGKK